ncbi:hypothetical protein LSAT2_004586 [Lamellibrachia satsuma]|nr:hypothetical protein LSAT2_004586 [Lamellibrachia satsuma]
MCTTHYARASPRLPFLCRQNFIDFKALTEFAVYIPRGQPLGTFSVNPASMKQSRRFANDHAKRFCAKDAWGRLRTITRVAMTFLRVRKSKWLLPSHGHPTADGSSTTSAGKASSVQRVVRSVVSPTSVDEPSADIPTEQPAASTTDIGHTPPSEFLRTIRLLSKALDISDVIYDTSIEQSVMEKFLTRVNPSPSTSHLPLATATQNKPNELGTEQPA